jgi:predicted glycosyltransferase
MKNYIWFDLVTPKSVLFFKSLIMALDNVIVTTRGNKEYKEVIELLKLYKIPYISIGKYGDNLEEKLKNSLKRQKKLIDIVKKYNIKKLVTLSSVDAIRVAFGLGIKIINFNDMPLKSYKFEYKNITPVTRLTAPFSSVLFKPFMVDDEIFLKLGVENIKTYNFIDPLIWLKDFNVDNEYIQKTIPQIDINKPIVVVREEEYKANYVLHQTSFLYEVIKKLQEWDINLVIIPRYESEYLKKRFKKAIVLEKKIILQNLLAQSNLFIGGGGTINIEACYFGVPVISTRSFISHYDKFLIDNNLMWHSNDSKEIISLSKKLIKQKTDSKPVFDKMEVDIDMFIKEMN